MWMRQNDETTENDANFETKRGCFKAIYTYSLAAKCKSIALLLWVPHRFAKIFTTLSRALCFTFQQFDNFFHVFFSLLDLRFTLFLCLRRGIRALIPLFWRYFSKNSSPLVVAATHFALHLSSFMYSNIGLNRQLPIKMSSSESARRQFSFSRAQSFVRSSAIDDAIGIHAYHDVPPFTKKIFLEFFFWFVQNVLQTRMSGFRHLTMPTWKWRKKAREKIFISM